MTSKDYQNERQAGHALEPSLKTPEYQSAKFVLLDIEGTISEIFFVKNVLFPYSAEKLRTYVSQHYNNPVVRDCLKQTGAPNDEAAIQQLHEWIRDDVKHPALKTLQGLIWRSGYESQAYRSHLYPDVVPTWRQWQTSGLHLGIYSSGSKAAQDLFFQYSQAGDVREYLEAHFDLAIGSKREVESYRKIASALNFSPSDILFLSDVLDELDAAREAGFLTGLLVRGPHSSPESYVGGHRAFTSLVEV